MNDMLASKEENSPKMNSNITYVNFNDIFCSNDDDFCRSNFGVQTVYRDTHHLTMGFVQGKKN
jgi:hypothetical protein